MTDPADRLRRLTPAQRRLLELRLRRQREEAGSTQPGAEPERSAPDHGLLAVTPEQEDAWVRCLQAPASTYHFPMGLRLDGDLDLPVLRRSLAEVVARHPALHSSVTTRDGRPWLRADPGFTPSLPVVDVQHVDEAERAAHVRDLLAERLRQPFDLSSPPWRALLVRLAPGRHLLAMATHEIVCDGMSRSTVVHELLDVYEAFLAGRQSPLPPFQVGLADFVAARRRWLAGAEAADHLAFWTKQLAGAVPLPLRGARPRPPVRSYDGIRLLYTMPDTTVRHLREFTAREGLTLYACLLAALSALLGRYVERTDVVLTTHVFNRAQMGADRLVGNFTTVQLVRCRWSGDPTFRELVHEARSAALQAHARKELPAGAYLARLGWDDHRRMTPAGQVTLVSIAPNFRPRTIDGLTVNYQPPYLGTATGDFGVFARERADAVDADVQGNTGPFSVAEIERFRGHLATVLGRALANPSSCLGALLSGIGSLADQHADAGSRRE